MRSALKMRTEKGLLRFMLMTVLVFAVGSSEGGIYLAQDFRPCRCCGDFEARKTDDGQKDVLSDQFYLFSAEYHSRFFLKSLSDGRSILYDVDCVRHAEGRIFTV